MAKTAAAAGLPADIAALNFEQALAELDQIVQRLEGGRVALEESIDIYTRGVLLKRHCEAKLQSAQERIEKIVIGPDGAVSAEPAAFG